MKPVIFLLVSMVCFSLPSEGQEATSSTELVIIRTVLAFKACGKSHNSAIHITEADGTTRIIELEQYEPGNYLTQNPKNLESLHKELKKYLSLGYRIDHFSSGQLGCAFFSDYVMTKD